MKHLPSQPSALTLTVVSLYRERRFHQPIELILDRHSKTYSTPIGDLILRLRGVVDEIAKFYELLKVPPSVCPVTAFYFERGHILVAGKLKGSLDERHEYYRDAKKCLAIQGNKIAGLRFARDTGDRLYTVWQNETMKIFSGGVESRVQKVVLASATGVISSKHASKILHDPVKAIRNGIDEIKRIPASIEKLKLGLDNLP